MKLTLFFKFTMIISFLTSCDVKENFNVVFTINKDKADVTAVATNNRRSLPFQSEGYLTFQQQAGNILSSLWGRNEPEMQTVEVWENSIHRPYKGQIITENNDLYFKLFHFDGNLLFRFKIDAEIFDTDTGFYIPANQDKSGYGLSGGKRTEIISEKWESLPNVACEVSHSKTETLPDTVKKSSVDVEVKNTTSGEIEKKKQETITTCKRTKIITWKTRGEDDQLVLSQVYRDFYEIVVEPDNFGNGLATFQAITDEDKYNRVTVRSQCEDTNVRIIGSENSEIDEKCSSETKIQ
jgi:hypothetical protein